METSSKKRNNLNITNDLSEIVKSASTTVNKSEEFKTWIDKLEKIANSIHFALNMDTYEKKEKELKKIEKENKLNLLLIGYLITSVDFDLVGNDNNFNILRHKYYDVQNQILELKNSIIKEKVDENFEKSNKKLSELESKFEGLGATVITIILSITVISSSIVAIEKIPSKLIPLFLVGVVWLGMTFLTFTNFLFRKKDTEIWTALIFYIAFSILFIVTLAITLRIIIY